MGRSRTNQDRQRGAPIVQTGHFKNNVIVLGEQESVGIPSEIMKGIVKRSKRDMVNKRILGRNS